MPSAQDFIICTAQAHMSQCFHIQYRRRLIHSVHRYFLRNVSSISREQETSQRNDIARFDPNLLYLLTGARTSVFYGPETSVVTRNEAEGDDRSRDLKHSLPTVVVLRSTWRSPCCNKNVARYGNCDYITRYIFSSNLCRLGLKRQLSPASGAYMKLRSP